jgi:hypothetical protein
MVFSNEEGVGPVVHNQEREANLLCTRRQRGSAFVVGNSTGSNGYTVIKTVEKLKEGKEGRS